MFFNLSKTKQSNFTNHYKLPNKLVLNTDQGWEVYTYGSYTIILKGYANNFNNNTLSQCMLNHPVPRIKGNFCAFVCTPDTVKILHDSNRSFPLWTSKTCVTNLSSCGDSVWADHLLTVDSDLNCTTDIFTIQDFDKKCKTDQQIVDTIHDTLCETFERFLHHNTLPLKIFLSGGLDTTLCWAYLDYFTKDYTVLDYEYVKYTQFYKANNPMIRKFWAYNQIHLWQEPTCLVTGSNGDENFLRGPTTLALALANRGIYFDNIMQPSDYHYDYYNKYKTIKQDTKQLLANIDDVRSYILSRNINDHQHWHLDNTIMFTPFKDISILAHILSGSDQLLISQARNGDIYRQLIERIDPAKLNILTDQKNP